jgi:hypothetical protein
MPLTRTTAIGATSPSLWQCLEQTGYVSYATPFRDPLNRWDLAQVLLVCSIVRPRSQYRILHGDVAFTLKIAANKRCLG